MPGTHTRPTPNRATARTVRRRDRERSGVAVAVPSALVLALALVLAVLAPPQAGADQHLASRGIAEACTDFAQSLDTFPDVARDGPHAGAVDCLSHWGIVRGLEGPDGQRVYAPSDPVERAGMASYLVRALQRLPEVDLPGPSDQRFPDQGTGPHADNVHVLRAAGVVQGFDDGTYRPRRPVTRAQMATYVVRALEFAVDGDLPVDQEGTFPGVDGVHRTDVDKLASIGVVTGRTQDDYAPTAAVTRAEMASFVARALDYLALRGHLPVAFEVSVQPAGEQVPSNLNQRVAGTVEDQFGRSYFSAAVRFEVYRDGALLHSAQTTSGPRGEVDVFYNAGAAEGDTDEVVACVVRADETPRDDVPFCLDDGEPAQDRRATSLRFGWGEPAVASVAPEQGQSFGIAINIDADDDVLGYQTLPSPPIPADAPIGDFLVREYVEEANFIVNGRTNVPVEEFECAVQASIEDERSGHLLDVSVGPDRWNSYALSTSTDVDACGT